MNQFNFWQSWHHHSRYFFYCLLIICGATLLYCVVSYFQNPQPVIQWELISNFDKVPVTLDQFKVGLFDFSYTADHYVVSETYRGSNVQFNVLASYMLLAIIAISFAILCTIVSTLRKFWFYFGALVLVALMVSFKLEQLLLFGNSGKLALIIALVLFLLPVYFFYSIAAGKGLLFRIATFGGLTALMAVGIAVFAEAEYPALVLLTHGITVPFVLSVFFIFMTAHVVISMLLVVVTRNNTYNSSHTILHFSILSVVYLVNLFLLYLKNTGLIDWDMLYLSAFLVLAVTAVLGLWEFRMREVQYQYVFPFSPIGSYFYLTLATITFATCTYFFATANDPAIEALEDSIVYSQLGYGLLFFLYIIANFVQPLMENKQVYKVMYKPNAFPYGTVQIVGTIATLAFFLNAGMLPFSQSIAAYYNGLADLNWLKGNKFLAQQYYKMGDQYGYNNHRSNYSLGALARMQQDEVLAPFYFREALSKNPSPYAYANLSNGLNNNRQIFDALFNLKTGLDQFPGNAYLQNNLALSYAKTSVLDSALIYLEQARADDATRKAAEANTLSIIARSANQLNFSVDTLLQEVETDPGYIQNQINKLLLFNQQGQFNRDMAEAGWEIPADSVLGSLDFAYLYNYMMNLGGENDSTLLQAVAHLAEKPENANYYEPLRFALAIAYYETNRVVDAFKILDNLQSLNPFKTGYYNNLLGLWALQQHAPSAAVRYFTKATQASYEDAAFRASVSKTEAAASGLLPWSEVKTSWQSLGSDTVEVSEGTLSVADEMLSLFNTDSLQSYLSSRDDAFLYQLLRYSVQSLSDTYMQSIFAAMEDLNYQVLAIHDLLLLYPEKVGDNAIIEEQIEVISNEASRLSPLGQDYWVWVQALAMQSEDYAGIAGLLDRLPDLSVWHQYKKHLYAAKIAEAAVDSSSVASEYQYLINNPFYVEGFLAAANHIYPDASSMNYYRLLLDAIQTNPVSPELLQAYIHSSIANGLDHYAEESLETLQQLMTAREFQEYQKTYEQLLETYTPSF